MCGLIFEPPSESCILKPGKCHVVSVILDLKRFFGAIRITHISTLVTFRKLYRKLFPHNLSFVGAIRIQLWCIPKLCQVMPSYG